MTIKLGMVMDPIETVKTYKDSSFAMLLAAQARGWQLTIWKCRICTYEMGSRSAG